MTVAQGSGAAVPLVTDADDGGMGLNEILDIILSRLGYVFFVFALIASVGVYYALTRTSIYVADALIQVEERKGSTLSGVTVAEAFDVSRSPIAGEIEIIRSREVVGRAIEVLKRDIAVRVMKPVPYLADLHNKRMGGRGIRLAPAKFGLSEYAWGGEQLVVDRYDSPSGRIPPALEIVITAEQRFRIESPAGTVLAEGQVGTPVSFTIAGRPAVLTIKSFLARPGQRFSVRKLTAMGAHNAAVRSLRVSEVARGSSVIRVTAEADDRHEAVALVNEIARAYLTQNVNRRSEEAEKSLEFLTQQLPELQREVERAERAFNAYRLSAQSIDLDREAEELLGLSAGLAKQNMDLTMRQQLLSQRFQPGSAEMQSLEKQRAVLQSEEVKLNAEIRRLPATQQEYFRLQRDVKVNTDMYIALLNNAQQLRVAKAGTIGNVRVIDFATLADSPIRPDRRAIVFGFLVAGLALGILSGFLIHVLRPTLRHAEEIERLTNLPTYAIVPESVGQTQAEAGKRKGRVGSPLLHDLQPDDPAVEALRSMRMGLQFATAGKKNKVVLLTGPTPGIGKTFITANLAAVIASSGKRVLVVDADMRRPRLSDYFDVPRVPGLSNYLAGDAGLEQIVHKAVSPNLDVISAGTLPPNPGELLLRERFKELLDAVESRYDYVVLDTPPLLPVGDTLTLAKWAGTVFFVLRAEQSTLHQFKDAARRMEVSGVSVTGVIFNGLKVKRLGYGYRYQYYSASYYTSKG